MNLARINSDLVYSTVSGRICSACGKPTIGCICREIADKKIIRGDGTVRISRETKGRKGKGVTVITGLPLPVGKLDDLARQLKIKCGCGGTVKNGAIEIQGEHRDLLATELQKLGFKAKRSGG
jgi:translation initiation factor 1